MLKLYIYVFVTFVSCLFCGCTSVKLAVSQWERSVGAHLDFSHRDDLSPLAQEKYVGSAERMIGGRFGWKEDRGQLWLEKGMHHEVAYYFAEPSIEGIYLGRMKCSDQDWDVFLLVVSKKHGMWYELGWHEGDVELVSSELVVRRAGPDSVWLTGKPVFPANRVFSSGVFAMTYKSHYKITCLGSTITAEDDSGDKWTVPVETGGGSGTE